MALTLSTNDPRWDLLYNGLMPHVWPHIEPRRDAITTGVDGSAIIALLMEETWNIILRPSDSEIWGTVTFEDEAHLTFLLLKYA